MESLKDFAEAYEAPAMKEKGKITELEIVRIDTPIVKKVVKEGTPDEFTVHEMEIEGIVYRVPVSVIAQIKGILEARPDTAAVKVNSTGSGMGTSYQVIPL